MNELDLALFRFAHESISIKEIYKNIHLNIAQKTIYTSICRLEKQGLITKKQQGKNLLIQQSTQPASAYLHTLLENQPHLIKKQVFSTTALAILLILLHERRTVKWITEISQLSERNTRRYLSKLHKAAVIIKHHDITTPTTSCWEISPLQRELLQFLEAYEEFRALKIIESIDANASLLWVRGIEFLIKTPHPVHQKHFTKTGAIALEQYGMKLLSTEHIYLHTKRTLTLWDHAFLTVLSRKNDANQLRYLAYLYKKHKPDLAEFIQKGTYYDSQSMQLVIDLFTKNNETPQLTMNDIQDLERLYGA
jgi:DNA-binding MarR family transcriptional regulator